MHHLCDYDYCTKIIYMQHVSIKNTISTQIYICSHRLAFQLSLFTTKTYIYMRNTCCVQNGGICLLNLLYYALREAAFFC